MINTKLLDELENHMRSEIGRVAEVLNSDCRNKALLKFYDAKFTILDHMMDDLKELIGLAEDYNGLEPSDYD